MEKFIVSARKYRPQNFSSVIGQSHITTTLKNAIRNEQLAHAFLFCGPRGVGKTTCARILAKTINCENRTEQAEACNTCNSCISFDNGTSLNIHELDAASNNSVDDIRSLVDQIRFAPQAGRYKVYIVDEVHMLSSQAFNAFLKTLEEPPPFAIFILATTEKHKILPTILSRCQIFDFKRITPNDTVEHLGEICSKESIECEKAGLHVIARKSEGCLRDALSILDKIVSFSNGHLTYGSTLEHLNILDEDYYFRMLESLKTQQLTDVMLIYDEINQKGFEGDIFLDGFAEFFRNLLVSKDARAAALLEVADDFREKYVSNAVSIPTGWVISALNIINECSISYKQARNRRLHIEMALIKLAYLKQALDLTSGENSTPGKAIAFRALKPVMVNSEIKLADTAGKKVKTEIPVPEPKIFVDKPKEAEPKITERATAGSTLSKIRSRIAEKNKNTKTESRALTQESAEACWKEFIELLKERENHSAVTNFQNTSLRPADPNTLELIVQSKFQQKFIEAERASLIEHLQNYFQNRQFKYSIIVIEPENSGPSTPVLSRKEMFGQLTEKYPLVKELRDRLKLGLE